MSRPVNATPPLPWPRRGVTIQDLEAFDTDLVRSLFNYLSDLARRANATLPKDGQEIIEGNIDFGGFSILNLGGITGTGTGTFATLRLTSAGDVTLASTTHAFQIGPDVGLNLVADQNEIQARNNGAISDLGLNLEGGNVVVGNASSLLDVNGTANFDGNMTSLAGLDFGSATAASPDDLSRHIALWGAAYGFSITGSQLNYVVASNADHVWYHGAGIERMRLDTSVGSLIINNTGNLAPLLKLNTERPWSFFQQGTGAGSHLLLGTDAANPKSFRVGKDDGSLTPFQVDVAGDQIITSGRINFPATQNPSTDANTLDDFEENVWTPTLTFATPGDLSVVYSVRGGDYQKIGRKVTAWFVVVTTTFTHTTASGELRITGLPYALGGMSATECTGTAETGGINMPAGDFWMSCNIISGVSYVRLVSSGPGRTAIAAADTTSGTQISIIGHIEYMAAS